MKIKVHVFPSWEEGKFYWNLKADNGEIVACSPKGFKFLPDAQAQVMGFIQKRAGGKQAGDGPDLNGPPAGYQVSQGEDEQWYWHYMSAMPAVGILAKGAEGYASKGGCQEAVDRMKSSTVEEPEP